MALGRAAKADGDPAGGIAALAGRCGARLAANGPRLVYAVNVGLITALALGLSFLLDIERSYWCLLTVALVAQSSSGTTVWRSVGRTIGTLLGGAFGLLVVAVFAQDPVPAFGCLALWVFAAGFFARFEIGLDAYAYSTAGLTALVIVIDTGPGADLAYGLGLARVTETIIGILATFAVLLVVFPVSASRTLFDSLNAARDSVLGLARRALAGGADRDAGDVQDVARALSATYGNLRAQKLERSHRRRSGARAAEATNRLNHLLMASGRLSFAFGADAGGLSEPAKSARAELARLIAAVPAPDVDANRVREAAAECRRFATALVLQPAIAASDAGPEGDLVALDAMRRFALGLAAFLDAHAALRDPAGAPPPPQIRPLRPRYPDRAAAFMRGLRPLLVFAVLGSLWLTSAASAFGTLALIGTGMSLTLPAIAPRAVLLNAGTVIGLGMAAMLPPAVALQMALPYAETFAVYAMLVGSVMAVFYYICFDPLLKSYGLGGAIFLAVTLQPANAETYDAVSLFNAAAALAFLPLVVGGAFAVIFPENDRWLRRRLAKASSRLLGRAATGRDDHVDEYVAQSLDAIGDYGGDLDLGSPANRPALRRAHALVAAGAEFYELRRLGRLDHLPPDLAAQLPALGEAATRAAAANDSCDESFAAARDAGTRAFANGALRDLQRQAALRFALGAEFIRRALDNDGPPSPPERT